MAKSMNPNSLSNLKQGGKKAAAVKKAAKTFVEKLVGELEKRQEYAFEALDDLKDQNPDKYLTHYIKLLERYIPAPKQEKEEVASQPQSYTFPIVLHGDAVPKPLLDILEMQQIGEGNEPPTTAELVVKTSTNNPNDRAKIVKI